MTAIEVANVWLLARVRQLVGFQRASAPTAKVTTLKVADVWRLARVT